MSNSFTMTSMTEITTINSPTTTDASHHSLRHSMSDTGYVTIVVVLSAVWVFGTVFNITGLYVFFTNKRLQSPTNMFVIALSVCDLCMSFIGTFMAMTSAWRKHWLYGHHGCVFEGFTVYFLGLTSVYLLSAISLDRYIVIARPLIGHLITHRVAGVSIALCWLGGFLWAAFPLFGWNEFRLEGAGISCSVVWEYTNSTYSSYIFVIFTFCLVIPLAVMVFSYYHVFMTIRMVSKNLTWTPNSRVARKNMKMERRMAKTMSFILMAFVGCWMPYAVFSFIVAFRGSDAISTEMATYPAVVAKCQGMINPVLYVATNKQFRQAFYNGLPCSSLRNSLIQTEEQRPKSSESEHDDRKHPASTTTKNSKKRDSKKKAEPVKNNTVVDTSDSDKENSTNNDPKKKEFRKKYNPMRFESRNMSLKRGVVHPDEEHDCDDDNNKTGDNLEMKIVCHVENVTSLNLKNGKTRRKKGRKLEKDYVSERHSAPPCTAAVIEILRSPTRTKRRNSLKI